MPALASPKRKHAAGKICHDCAIAKRLPKRVRPSDTVSIPIGVLQPKLKVNDPNDQFEHEADRIADRVMSMPEPKAGQKERNEQLDREQTVPIQRQEMAEEGEEEVQREEAEPEAEEEEVQREEATEPEEEEVQREEAEPEEEEVQTLSLQRQEEEVEEEEPMQARARTPRRPRLTPQFETHLKLMRRHGGQPLPDPLRAFLEPRLGRELADIRVHVGPAASELAREANAHAFTVGKHIVFGDGEFRPNVEQGQRLIAHELTHVFQQRGGLHSVQREIALGEEAPEKTKRTETDALEELRELFQIKRSAVSPKVLQILEELLRTTLHSDSASSLMSLIDDAGGASVKRIIEAGGYTLEFHIDRRGAGTARWSLTRNDTQETFTGRSHELPGDHEPASGVLDEERLTIATPTPPRYETDAEPAVESPPPMMESVAPSPTPSEPSPAPTPVESDALAAADAAPEIEPPPEPEVSGANAGKDDPALARPPIDEDPEAEQVPEEPPAEEVEVQRKAAAAGPPPARSAMLSGEVAAVERSSGRPLPNSLRRFMEVRVGSDLSRVRLHEDARASRLARSLGAKAFTHREHIVFATGRFQPETLEGRRLIAHEISHVLQQKGRARGLLQRQGDECPPPDPIPEVEVVQSPTSPQADPAFRQSENRVDNRAENQAQHGEGEDKSVSANAAADVKEGEKQSHAQKDQVGKMDAEAQSPPPFDKQAFVTKVLEQVESIAPGTLGDVDSFKSNAKAAEVKDAVTGQVEESQEASQGPLQEAASADPGPGESPRTASPLEIETPGAQPGSVRADRAMPPPRTDSEIDLSAETIGTENILKEACITREFMDKHDDPELKEGVAAQDGLKEATETLPAEFREEEAGTLEAARAGATAEGAGGVQAMFEGRSGNFAEVAQGQQQAKTENEAKRDQAAIEINGVFTSTQEKVQTRLKKLDDDVMTKFDTEAAAAAAKCERFIDENLEKHKKSWFESFVEEWADALFDIPPREVQDFVAEGLRTFREDLRTIIEGIADLVDTGLKDARKLVEDGKAEVQTKLDALGTGLEDFKAEIAEQMNDKFRSLEGEIVQKQADLVQGLAQRYVKAYEETKKRAEELREKHKNWVEKAKDAYNAVKDLVVGQIEKLAALVGDVATRIIKDPGTFLSNLGQGIVQGLTMFIGSIGENIKEAVVTWLTGNLGGAGVALPTSFDAKGIIGFLLDLVGLGVSSIKSIARKVLGSKVVALIEAGEAGAEKIKQIFDILASEGPAGLFQFLQAEFSEMKEKVLGEAGQAIAEGLVIAGIKKVLGIISGLVSGGVGTIITIVLTIIDVILWFRDNAAQLAELVGTIAGTAMAILQGQVGVVAGAINNVLKRLLPVVLSFVGALIGIGAVVRKIQQIFKAIKTPATKAITALFNKLKSTIKKLLGKAKGKGKEKGELSPAKVRTLIIQELEKPAPEEDPAKAIASTKQLAQTLTAKYQPKLKKNTIKITIIDQTPAGVEEDGDIDIDVALSPGTKVARRVKRKMPTKVINFLPHTDKSDFWREQYDSQLAGQESAINAMQIKTWRANRQKFEDFGRDPASAKEQEKFRREFEAKMLTEERKKVAAELRAEGLSKDDALEKADSIARKRVAKFMKENAALHDPDQVAGGSPSEIKRMGLKSVNSSIGSQWRTRAGELTTAVDDFLESKGDPEGLMKVSLSNK